MALPLPKPKALLADKGYDGDRFRITELRNYGDSLLNPLTRRSGGDTQ